MFALALILFFPFFAEGQEVRNDFLWDKSTIPAPVTESCPKAWVYEGDFVNIFRPYCPEDTGYRYFYFRPNGIGAWSKVTTLAGKYHGLPQRIGNTWYITALTGQLSLPPVGESYTETWKMNGIVPERVMGYGDELRVHYPGTPAIHTVKVIFSGSLVLDASGKEYWRTSFTEGAIRTTNAMLDKNTDGTYTLVESEGKGTLFSKNGNLIFLTSTVFAEEWRLISRNKVGEETVLLKRGGTINGKSIVALRELQQALSSSANSSTNKEGGNIFIAYSGTITGNSLTIQSTTLVVEDNGTFTKTLSSDSLGAWKNIVPLSIQGNEILFSLDNGAGPSRTASALVLWNTVTGVAKTVATNTDLLATTPLYDPQARTPAIRLVAPGTMLSVTGNTWLIGGRPTVSQVMLATGEARPLAPLALGTIKGGSLCDILFNGVFGPDVVAQKTPWPTEVGGCRVKIDGKAVPLHFAATFSDATAQINFQVPLTVIDPKLVVERIGKDGKVILASEPFRFTIESVSPGLFGNADFPAILQIANRGNVLVNKSNPMRPGDVPVFYGTGFGETAPLVPEGLSSIDVLGSTLADVRVPVEAFIRVGPVSAKMEGARAVASPQFPGVTQGYFVVPASLSLKGEGKLLIKVGNSVTAEYTVFLE